MKRYRYKDTLPIETKESSAWLIEIEDGRKFISIWCREAKIEDIVKYIKLRYPQFKFTVASIDIGMFEITAIDHSYGNARKLNQNMRIIIAGDEKYDFSKIKRIEIKKKNIKYKDIPF